MTPKHTIQTKRLDNALRILNTGVSRWNAWRKANPVGSPNLRTADLRERRLKGIDFHKTILVKANLEGAGMCDADLGRAILRGANLSRADLRGTDLRDADFTDANLRYADLSGADLQWAEFYGADLSHAKMVRTHAEQACFDRAIMRSVNLSESEIYGASFREADLSLANVRWAHSAFHEEDVDYGGATDFYFAKLRKADLRNTSLAWASFCGTDLEGANLSGADLWAASVGPANMRRCRLRDVIARYASFDDITGTGVDVAGSDLSHCRFVRCDFRRATIRGCNVYGTATWDVDLTGADQADLVIADPEDDSAPRLTIDELEIAQFIYLLLNNRKLRRVIDSISSKVVLILGRFSPKRMSVLDALRNELRRRNYVPLLFDFEKPRSRDLTETIGTLAHMARFIIADLTEARSLPQELATIVPHLPSVPIQPLLCTANDDEYAMFEHFKRYRWVLKTCIYTNEEELLTSLKSKIIAPAEKAVKLLMQGKHK